MNAWGRANAPAPDASCASCLRSPIFPTPATPQTGAPALPPTHDRATPDAANGAHRSASAALSNCRPPRASPAASPPATSASLIPPANADLRSSRPAGISLPVTRGDPGGSHDYRAPERRDHVSARAGRRKTAIRQPATKKPRGGRHADLQCRFPHRCRLRDPPVQGALAADALQKARAFYDERPKT